MKHFKPAYLLGFFGFGLFYACGIDQPRSQRTSEFGLYTFEGGGGCNGSSTLAVGSSATVTLKTTDGTAMPGNLTPRSLAPSVIAAIAGHKAHTVKLTAHKAGQARVELSGPTSLDDSFSFSAEPAATVELDTPATRTFAGGTFVLKMGEIYGACGKECPLIGGGFLRWSSSPGGALSAISDVERTATFSVGKAPGPVTLRGTDPATGRVLVNHKLQVLETSAAGKLTADLIVAFPRTDGGKYLVVDPAPRPVHLPVGSLLMPKVVASTAAGPVPVWGKDIVWTVKSGAGLVETYPLGGDPPPAEGTIYTAKAPGKVKLVGNVALLGASVTVDLTVAAPQP